jgi:DUF4097 and DUF4098 domain-containing protein YvlB
MPQYTFDATDPLEIMIRNAAGEVDVTCADSAGTEVRVTAHRPADREAAEQTIVVLEGRRLRIEVPEKRWGNSPRIGVRVSAPAGSQLSAKIASAGVRCMGTLSALTVAGASGDVAAPVVEGDATVTSASGDVTLAVVTGTAQVRTASGDVTAAQVCALDVATASGDVTVGSLAGTLRVRTASGDVQLSDAGSGTVEVGTTSGDIIVGVRRGAAVRLDLSSQSGEVRSELAVEDAAPRGGTTLSLRLHSVSGDIDVRRGPASQVA